METIGILRMVSGAVFGYLGIGPSLDLNPLPLNPKALGSRALKSILTLT